MMKFESDPNYGRRIGVRLEFPASEFLTRL